MRRLCEHLNKRKWIAFVILSSALLFFLGATPAFAGEWMKAGGIEPGGGNRTIENHSEEHYLSVEQARLYEPGQIVVKIKKKHVISELAPLNQQYGAVSVGKIFKDRPDDDTVLKQLHRRLKKLDSDSAKFIAAQKRIKAVEKRKKRRERRLKRAPKGAKRPDLSVFILIRFDEDAPIEDIIEAYRNHPAVEAAEYNYKIKFNMEPNDPYYTNGDLYGLINIQAADAWDITTGREDVVVAILESGVNIEHEDLIDNIWLNEDEILNGEDTDGNGYVDDIHGVTIFGPDEHSGEIPDYYHGTAVAGIIAASGDNGLGTVGVAWGARVMPVIMGTDISTNAAQCIVYAVDNGAQVISNSWVSLLPLQDERVQMMEAAIDYAHSQGCVIVAAAGNENTRAEAYTPARLNKAITVGAVNQLDRKSYFSNYGLKLDVVAPGEDIRSPMFYNSYYGIGEGTSYACPYVSGLAALIISHNLDLNESDPATYPILSNEQIRQIIRKSADDIIDPLGDGSNYEGFDIYSGHGRINAYKALQYTSACKAKIFAPESNKNFLYMSQKFCNYMEFYENGYTLVTGLIDIQGIAAGDHFTGYELAHGKGYHPDSWAVITQSTTPVEGVDGDDLLYAGFDTDQLENGVHTIRLTVYDDAGQSYEDRIMINTRRAVIYSFPEENPGIGVEAPVVFEPKTIYGCATGPGFISAHLEYGLGRNPLSWEIISSEITNPVHGIDNFVLYNNFDFSQLPNGIGTLKLVTEDSILGQCEHSVVINNDPIHFEYQNGFPIPKSSLPYSGESSMTIADLENNGSSKEIIFGAYDSSGAYLVVYNSDGTERFRTQLDADKIYGTPAVGNVDDDPELEIGLKYASLDPKTEYVDIFDSDGTKLPEWQTVSFQVWGPCDTGIRFYEAASVVFADLDQDGISEIIFGATAPDLLPGRLYVYHFNGENFESFPGFENGKESQRIITHGPVVGDINHDGKPEIVAKDMNNVIYAWDKNGALLWSCEEIGIPGYYTRLALTDFDNDGFLEIVHTTMNPSGVSIWNYQGTKIMSMQLPEEVSKVYPFSIGDMDNDREPEIVVPAWIEPQEIGEKGQFLVFCLEQDGSSMNENWPVYIDYSIFPAYPLIADVNNDGQKEAIMAANVSPNKEIIAIQADGQHVAGEEWPIRKEGKVLNSMALGDLDNDGDTELVAKMQVGPLYVWDLPYDYIPGNIDWPMFKHDAGNTGVCDVAPPQVAILSPEYTSTVSTYGFTLSGTATDTLSGVDEVIIKANTDSDPYLDINYVHVPVDSEGNWSFHISADYFDPEGGDYVWCYAKAVDNDGNSSDWDIIWVLTEVTPDNTPPTITYLSPPIYSVVPSSGFTVTGIVTDDLSGVKDLLIGVYSFGGPGWLYWDEPVSFDEQGNWSWEILEEELVPGENVWVYMRAFDNADNYPTTYQTRKFTVSD